MAKRKQIPGVDPAFLEKQKASLLRMNRQVIYFNDREMEAVEAYCSLFNVKARATLFREAIMDKILSGLDENHPTLF